MNWDAIGAIGEIAGALVVIFTIAYLARQVKEANLYASAEAEREVQDRWNSLLSIWGSDSRAREVIRKGHRSFFQLSDDEKVIYHCQIGMLLNHFEMVLRMHEKRLISDDVKNTYSGLNLATLSTPGGREFWEHELVNLSAPPLSREYINENLDKADYSGFPWWTESD